jgi:hypothetical protein
MPAYLGTFCRRESSNFARGDVSREMSTDSGYLLTWATVIYNDLIMPCVKRPLSAGPVGDHAVAGGVDWTVSFFTVSGMK